MADVFSKRKRSEVMSRIRSRGNLATEVRMVMIMKETKIHGWRRHFPVVLARAKISRPGRKLRPRVRPDFVFRQQKVAVFIDGCFWHGCPRHGVKPRQNAEFWATKLQTNLERDRFVTRELRKAGWKVLRFWEHQMEAPEQVIARLKSALRAE